MNSIIAIAFSTAAMAFLTIAVGIRLFIDRSREMRERRVHPQTVSTSRQMAERLQSVQSADNFRNLFEVPVLFYALCATVLATQLASPALAIGAWLFVALRVAHSVIHCTYNKVMHRFATFIASMLVLAVLWILFVVQLLTHAQSERRSHQCFSMSRGWNPLAPMISGRCRVEF